MTFTPMCTRFVTTFSSFCQDANVFLHHHLPTRQTAVVAKAIILAIVIPR